MEDFILVETDQKIRTKNNAMTSKHHLNYFDMLVHRMKHAFMIFRLNPAIVQIIEEKGIVPISEPQPKCAAEQKLSYLRKKVQDPNN